MTLNTRKSFFSVVLAINFMWSVAALQSVWAQSNVTDSEPTSTQDVLPEVSSKLPSPEAIITQAINEVIEGSGEVISVQPLTHFPNLYEVLVNEQGVKRILYSNATGSHVLLGSVVNTQTMENLTALRMTDLNRIEFDRDLRTELALISIRGEGSRRLAIFEDPRCTYCKSLRQQVIESLDDVTLYTYIYPVLGPTSVEMAQTALCAADPNAAWHDWMVNNVPLEESPSSSAQSQSDCEPPIDQLLGLGVRLGVQSTPALVFEDGTLTKGELSAETVQRLLAKASAWREAQQVSDTPPTP